MFSEALAESLRKSDYSVVVTGVGSWFGQATLMVLEHAFGERLSNRVHLFGSTTRSLRLPSGRTGKCCRIGDIVTLPPGRYLFMHYAFITKAHVCDQPLSEYVRLNREIAELVEIGSRRVDVEGFFLPSSGAVYRSDRTLCQGIEENPYAAMKLEDERRFQAMSDEVGCRLMPIRVFNVAGPCMNNLSNFVLGSIIRDVLRGRAVELKSENPVFRSYIHIIDLVELAIAGLLRPDWNVREPFDTAGEIVVEVGDLARRVLDVLRVPDLPIIRRGLDTTLVDRYVGDPTDLRKHAHSIGITLKSLSEMILDTARDLRVRLDKEGDGANTRAES